MSAPEAKSVEKTDDNKKDEEKKEVKPLPAEADLEAKIREFMKGADLESLTAKKIRLQLEAHYGQDLTELKKKIGDIIAKVMEEEPEDTKEDSKEDSQSKKKKAMEEEDARLARELAGGRPRRAAAAESHRKAEKRKLKEEKGEERKTKRRKMPPRLSPVSPEMATFLGVKETTRGDIMKKVWEHIRANNLQDPKDKRFILPDSKLSPIIGEKRISMFKMTKPISKHIFKKGEVIGNDEEEEEEDDGEEEEEEEEEEKKKPKKAKKESKKETQKESKKEKKEKKTTKGKKSKKSKKEEEDD